MSRRRVAVLGAGIMGCSVAIQLARRGFDVTVFDRELEAMAAASRWNEGKIHLGYIYGADPTLSTARHLLTGGLLFAERLRELIDADLADHVTAVDDIYLVHRDSLVGPEVLRLKFDQISSLVREHPDASRYLVDVSNARTEEIPADELRTIAGADILAAFRVPERSVETRWVADRLIGAAASTAGIAFRLGTVVVGVEARDGSHGPWSVRTYDSEEEKFRSRRERALERASDDRRHRRPRPGAAMDPSVPAVRVHTYAHEVRPAERARRRRPLRRCEELQRSRLLHLLVPRGLTGQSSDLELEAPPVPTGAAADAFIARVRGALEPLMPGLGRVFDDAESAIVHGGFVFAQGSGALDDPRSGLHRRDRYGVQRRGSYFSVDTGKYSTAPWLARELAMEIAG